MALTNSGFDGTVNEAQYANMWALGGVDAVSSSGAWAVTQGTGRQVSVAAQAGYAFARGVLSIDSAAITAALGTPTNGQWYLIVRRINWATNTVSVVAIPHSTTSTTVPTVAPGTFPTFNDNPGVLYDHKLAWAWVNSVNTTVTLFDLRTLGLETRLTGFATTASVTAVSGLLAAPMQMDTTNSVVPAPKVQFGIGRIAGIAALTMNEAVTFPTPFATGAFPVVNVTFGGTMPTGAFNPGATSASANVTAKAVSATPTGFSAQIERPTNMSVGFDYYYSWVAIGVPA